MKIYVLIWDDNHIDLGVTLFLNQEEAIDRAIRIAKRECADYETVYEPTEISPEGKSYGCIYSCLICDGISNIGVLEREVNV